MNETGTHRGALPPGTRVHEFEFQRVLGHGGFGITYLGLDTLLDKVVAIKEYMPVDVAVREADHSVYPKTREDEQDYRWGLDRFLHEARMLARFDHPAIVRVQRFFEAHGTACIVMEYVEGQTLGALYRAESPLEESRLRAFLAPILDGLAQVHDAELLHRDITPGNIMIRGDGAPVLIDFGAARAAVAVRSQSMTAVVTPGFAPIEQYSTESRQGPWTDIYAVGAVLYRGMTGRAPIDAASRAIDDRLVPVTLAAAGRYERSLADAVDWALRLRGADRPGTIGEWREVLEGRRPAPPDPRREPSPSAGTHAPVRSAGRSAAVPPRTEESSSERRKTSGPGRWLAVIGVVAVMAVAGGAWWWDELVRLGASFSIGVTPPGDDSTKHDSADGREAEAAAREALVAESDAQLARGEYRTARETLGRARAAGLSEAEHAERAARIDRAEREARAEEIERLMAQCGQEMAQDRLRPALDCFGRVLALEPGHEEARTAAASLASSIAWDEAKGTHSVEGYYRFEHEHARSAFAQLARKRLQKLEARYWQEVEASGTRDAYERYLEIYPEGPHAEEARRRGAATGG